jgi:hypothetical protein
MKESYWQGVVNQLQVEKKYCQRRIADIEKEIGDIEIVQAMNKEGG